MSFSGLLFDELHEDALAAIPQQLAGVRRPWCDPCEFDDVIGVDFGLGKVHLYFSKSGRSKSVGIDSASRVLLSLPRRSLVITEWAHLAVPQTARSLAQPFTAAELLGLYEKLAENQITLRLFPHACTSRAREWVAHHMSGIVTCEKSSDINDAIALALFVSHCNDISLAKPPKSFMQSESRDYGKAVRGICNVTLNAERTRNYSGKLFPHVVGLGKAIFGKCASDAIDKKVAVSIAATIICEIDGNPFLFVRRGSCIGACLWMRHVMLQSPWHHRGGVCRSNVMRHRFRPFLAEFAKRRGVRVKSRSKYQRFASYDPRQERTLKKAKQAFRQALKNAYRVGVEIACSKGFPLFDPTATPEVPDGR